MRAIALALSGAALGVTSCALVAQIETFERAPGDAGATIGDGALPGSDDGAVQPPDATSDGRSAEVIGFVGLLQMRPLIPAEALVASADFWPPSVTGCTTTVTPPCVARICAETRTYASAGNISIAAAGNVTMLTPGSDKSYSTSTTSGADGGFVSNSLVSFSAGGADIAAFQGNVVPPSEVSFTKPASGTITYDANGLGLVWVGGAPSDAVVATILGSSPTGDNTSSAMVDCRFDAKAGSGTIPASVLDLIGSGSTVLLGARSSARVAAGAYDVELVVDAMSVYGQLGARN